MTTTKLTAPVRTPDGEVTTIDALAAAGRIVFREVLHFAYRKNPAYFADLDNTTAGWEISRLAYLSRTGQPVTLKSDRKTEAEDYRRVDPTTLQQVTDVWGDVHYIVPGYSPDRLVRTYHADGRRVVVIEGHGRESSYRHLLIHPENIVNHEGAAHE